MPRLTKEKVAYVNDQLTNNESSTDAEMVLDIAAKIGKPVCKVAKLVKCERTYFSMMFANNDAEKIIRKYLK